MNLAMCHSLETQGWCHSSHTPGVSLIPYTHVSASLCGGFLRRLDRRGGGGVVIPLVGVVSPGTVVEGRLSWVDLVTGWVGIEVGDSGVGLPDRLSEVMGLGGL